MRKRTNLLFEQILDEALLMIGSYDKGSSFPKHNQMLLLAGGSGVGKDYILDNLLGFEGKEYNPDDFKEQILKFKPESIRNEMEKYGYDLDSMSISDMNDLRHLHWYVADSKLIERKILSFIKNQRKKEQKENIIFNYTTRNFGKIKEIAKYANIGGYDKKDIHIVWVLNDYETAQNANMKRERSVHPGIVEKTHIGSANTIRECIKRGEELREYIDGEIWLVPNLKGVDNTVKNGIIENYTCYKLKERGKAPLSMKEIDREVINKINSYIPDEAKRWG